MRTITHVIPFVVAFWGAACCALLDRGALTRQDAVAHAREFRRGRSLEDLQALLPALKVGLPRAQVERIMGEPDYCPGAHQCYYYSRSKNSVGVTYGVILEYEVLNPFDGVPTPPPGTLQSVTLMAIGE